MTIDPREFRDSMGSFVTGVTVITTRDHRGQLVGNTVNSFNSVSLDPPLILWSLGRLAYSMRAYLSSEYFAVNVLREGQEPLSVTFAKPSSTKWEGVEHRIGETGCPILPGVLAVFECKIAHTYMGGDHVIFVGEVVKASADPDGRPLAFFRGAYAKLA
ncbi:MAG: flavin reductase family protein [Pseudomonadota bacterium]|nr:flavin reductase family protein [Pseudomonadota bacterium]